jgi:5-formyltetrahydrofolate cyclo-ligase
MDKNSLRVDYKKQREALTPEEVANKSLQIANQLLSLALWEKNNFHLFLSNHKLKEVDTEYVLTLLQGKDKEVIVPRMEPNFDLSHILLTDATPIKPNSYGIPEPTGGIAVSPATIEVVFVPLLAYDINGNRIGYGKGYYDRFLAQCDPKCNFIGLSFFPPEQSIPAEETDIKLHYCITPETVYSFL